MSAAEGLTAYREEWLLVAGFLFGFREDRARFGIFLPFAANVVFSDELLFSRTNSR